MVVLTLRTIRKFKNPTVYSLNQNCLPSVTVCQLYAGIDNTLVPAYRSFSAPGAMGK